MAPPFSPKELEQREKKQLQAVREKFFPGRDASDVSDDRVFRKLTADRALQNFKDRYTTEVAGTGVIDPKTGKKKGVLLQMTPDAPRNLAKERMRLANLYGPTLREIGSDIRFGLGRIAQDFKDKGAPMFQAVKGGLENIYNFLTQKRNVPPRVGTVFPIPRSDVRNFFGSMNTGVKTQPVFVPPTFNDQKIIREYLDPIQMPTSSFNNMDMSGFRAENFGLPSLQNLYNFSQNPEINTNVGTFRLDNVFTGDPKLGYGNTVLINGVPVNLNATIGQEGLGLGASMTFKKGGSVDKYGGLGYKLK